jgi:hypothetical protein
MITLEALERGCAKFWKYERRDVIYRIAEKLVKDEWDDPGAVADRSWRCLAYLEPGRLPSNLDRRSK